jgi:hypothetical protein
VLSEILLACKELIADAKNGCADLVFKDVCLDILAKARLVLDYDQFEELRVFAIEKIKDKPRSGLGRRVKIE